MNFKCVGFIILLLSVIAGGLYLFLPVTDKVSTRDKRTLIKLAPSERQMVLAEMRSFLISVQQVSKGIANNEMSYVISAARKSGAIAQGRAPESLAKKLPLAFKQMGLDTHRKFDLLAQDAEDLGDRDHALTQLSKLMKNCITCHEMYRISGK